jgi:hypothetical protein
VGVRCEPGWQHVRVRGVSPWLGPGPGLPRLDTINYETRVSCHLRKAHYSLRFSEWDSTEQGRDGANNRIPLTHNNTISHSHSKCIIDQEKIEWGESKSNSNVLLPLCYVICGKWEDKGGNTDTDKMDLYESPSPGSPLFFWGKIKSGAVSGEGEAWNEKTFRPVD